MRLQRFTSTDFPHVGYLDNFALKCGKTFIHLAGKCCLAEAYQELKYYFYFRDTLPGSNFKNQADKIVVKMLMQVVELSFHDVINFLTGRFYYGQIRYFARQICRRPY